MAAETFQHEATRELRADALKLPGVLEGESCVKRAFKAGSKGFLYLGEQAEGYNVMLKVDESLDAARAFCAEDPDNRSVGRANWVTLNFAGDAAPPAFLADWIEESFRAQAPKKLLAKLNSAQEAP